MWADSLLVLCSLSVLVPVVVAFEFAAALRRISWHDPPAACPERTARLSVIIPARDEEQDLAAAVQSVLQQVGVDLEIFVVNDHSSDRTGQIAESLARSDPRLKVIHEPVLPSGWLGKCNAMQQAAAVATGEYLVFTDADVRHAPTCFGTALAELERQRYDLLSLFPLMHFVSLWENVIVPALLAGIAQFASRAIEDPQSADAIAAGAFIMVRSEAFRVVGGFEAIRCEVFDDVALARLLKRRGYRVGLRAAPRLLQVRMYKGNRHAFWGMTKNVLSGLGGRLWLAPAVMLLPILVFGTPLLCAVAGLWGNDPRLVLAAVGTYALQYATLWPGRQIFSFHPGKALFFPLVAIAVVCCLTRALFLMTTRGSIHWRGRTIRVRGH
jgi:glycosyltransferase involved in cell wall biosynthesis